MRAASLRLSWKVTAISFAPSTTWWLVTMWPSSETTKPEPTPVAGCQSRHFSDHGPRSLQGLRSPKKRRMNSCGPPGNSALMVFSTRMFTTAGVTRSMIPARLGSAAEAASGAPEDWSAPT